MPVPPIPPAQHFDPANVPVKVIAIYNNKGGVAKTTSCYTLGYAMASKGIKVIMFDFDAQRNLSQAVLRSRTRKHGDTFASYLERLPHPHTVAEALMPAVTMNGPVLPMYADLVATFPVAGGELRLAIGDERIAQFEERIPLAEGLFDQQPALASIPGAPYHMIVRTAVAYGAAVCIVDLSPSIGALNRTLLCSSDYFMLPCAGEYFTMEAVQSLARFMVGPNDNHFLYRASAICRRQRQLAELPLLWLRRPAPMFLGTLMTRFNVKDRDMGALPRSVQSGISSVHAAVRTVLVPALRNITPANRAEPLFQEGANPPIPTPPMDLTFSDARFAAAGVDTETYNLVMLRDFFSLNPIAQFLSTPAPFVTKEMGQALKEWSTSQTHAAALAAAAAANVPIGLDCDQKFSWDGSMVARAADMKVATFAFVGRVLDLMEAPMVIRNRPFQTAQLAPLFHVPGANAVGADLVFVGF